jgi:hypothetical protein
VGALTPPQLATGANLLIFFASLLIFLNNSSAHNFVYFQKIGGKVA